MNMPCTPPQPRGTASYCDSACDNIKANQTAFRLTDAKEKKKEYTMPNEIEVYGDDDGLMLLGDSEDIRKALAELQIKEEQTVDISMPRY